MNIWDFWAQYYDRLWVQQVSLGPTRRLVTAAVKQRLAENNPLSVLDIGCGTGQQYGDLKSLPGFDQMIYRGIDASAKMIQAAQAKFPEADFSLCNVADFHSDRQWDIIICSHSFPYYQSGPEILRQLSKMLNSGGMLLLAQACSNTLFDRIVLSVVECTTGKAHYRSIDQMEELGRGLFDSLHTVRIAKQFFMPSLYLFRWKK